MITCKGISDCILRFLSVFSGIIMMCIGILDIILTLRIVVNFCIFLSGLFLIICDAKRFNFYRYVEFMFTPLGRCIFIAIIGSILSQDGYLFQTLFGIGLIIISIIYLLIAYIRNKCISRIEKKSNTVPLDIEQNIVTNEDSTETRYGVKQSPAEVDIKDQNEMS